MTLRHALSVSFLCARMGFRQSLRDWILIFGSFLVYTAIMLLYAGVIHMIPDADLARFPFGQKEMIWYLGTAEYILFAAPHWCFTELQNDILSGQIHSAVLRPVSAALVRVSFWIGDSAARAAALFVPYFLLVSALAGGNVFSPAGLLGLWASMPLAIGIGACGWYFVGASCLWFIQAEPAYWVWQKAAFLLGAMLWPLSFYPGWLQVIAWASPFPSMLAIGARWTLETPASIHLAAFAHQIFWAAVFLFLLRLFDRKILRHLQETGV